MKNIPIVIILVALITNGCVPKVEINTPEMAEITHTQTPKKQTVGTKGIEIQYDSEPPQLNCAGPFDHRELQESYQRQNNNQPRYTLSTDELKGYFLQMGIKSICIPQDFGSPFVSVDWNSETNTSVTGRMISISFEGLYPGAGWGDGYIVYSTYDFAAGTEYDRFASAVDLQYLQNGGNDVLIESNGIMGLKRFHTGLGYESVPIFMTYVYPFTSYYVAFVYRMGDFDAEIETVIEKFHAEDYPPDVSPMIELFEQMAQSVTFDQSR